MSTEDEGEPWAGGAGLDVRRNFLPGRSAEEGAFCSTINPGVLQPEFIHLRFTNSCLCVGVAVGRAGVRRGHTTGAYRSVLGVRGGMQTPRASLRQRGAGGQDVQRGEEGKRG